MHGYSSALDKYKDKCMESRPTSVPTSVSCGHYRNNLVKVGVIMGGGVECMSMLHGLHYKNVIHTCISNFKFPLFSSKTQQ